MQLRLGGLGGDDNTGLNINLNSFPSIPESARPFANLGIDIAKSLDPSLFGTTGGTIPGSGLGPQTSTPGVGMSQPAAPSGFSGLWDVLKRYWYVSVPVALAVAGGIAKGRRR